MEAIIGLFFLYMIYRGLKKLFSSSKTDSFSNDDIYYARGDEYSRKTTKVTANYQSVVSRSPKRGVSLKEWIPLKQLVSVHGMMIPGGIYRGDRYEWPISEERHIIDFSLPVKRSSLFERLPYWPDYSTISPENRYGFLKWLAAGSDNSDVPIGYVFLYFYGIEYRRFNDKFTSEERDTLRQEVIRLLLIYGGSGSVNSYLTNYLVMDQLSDPNGIPVYNNKPRLNRSYELDIVTQVAIGQVARDGVPLPADWALKMALTHEELRWTTPMSRCMEELNELFTIRYHEAFGEGILLKPNKRELVVSYTSASSTFTKKLDFTQPVPTVRALEATKRKLAVIVEDCSEELAGYSRVIGRDENARNELSAIAQLPPELAKSKLRETTAPFVLWLRNKTGQESLLKVKGAELINAWTTNEEEKTATGSLRKRSNESLSNALSLLCFGMVPDLLIGEEKINPEATVFIYSTESKLGKKSSSYSGIDTTLKLLAMVANGDGEIKESEIARMQQYVESHVDLTEREKQHLRVRASYLCENPPKLRSVGKEITFAEKDRERVAKAALSIAMADGSVDRGELKILEKLYKLLDLDEGEIFNHINSLNHDFVDPEEPVTVRKADPVTDQGYQLPKQRPEKLDEPKKKATFSLDLEAIAAKELETAESAALLAAIFQENDEIEETPQIDPEQAVELENESIGLDAKHLFLLNKLLSHHEKGSEADFELLAKNQGLMTGGALETINEWGFDQFDDLVLEEGESLTVNPDILTNLKSLLAR